MLRSTHQVNAEPRGTGSIDFNLFVYKFDATKPWQQFKDGHPVASSVERGRRNLNSNKLKRVYLPKKKKRGLDVKMKLLKTCTSCNSHAVTVVVS